MFSNLRAKLTDFFNETFRVDWHLPRAGNLNDDLTTSPDFFRNKEGLTIDEESDDDDNVIVAMESVDPAFKLLLEILLPPRLFCGGDQDPDKEDSELSEKVSDNEVSRDEIFKLPDPVEDPCQDIFGETNIVVEDSLKCVVGKQKKSC